MANASQTKVEREEATSTLVQMKTFQYHCHIRGQTDPKKITNFKFNLFELAGNCQLSQGQVLELNARIE